MTAHSRWSQAGLCLLGIVIGAYGALCGIGGGIFAVPLLHYVYRMPLKLAVANSLVLVAASTTSATVVELFHPDSAMNWPVIAVLIASSFFGARLGYRAARAIDVNKLKLVFVVLLTLVGTQVLFAAPRTPAQGVLDVTRFDPSLLECLTVALIGLAAGFVAPLLGIGGGLIAVPGLLFVLPPLGYLGARACTMAMSTFTAWQSVVLYKRAGDLRLGTSIWLGIGATIGAALGIALVHVEGVATVAQSLVSFALFFAAARFAWDVWVARQLSKGIAR